MEVRIGGTSSRVHPSLPVPSSRLVVECRRRHPSSIPRVALTVFLTWVCPPSATNPLIMSIGNENSQMADVLGRGDVYVDEAVFFDKLQDLGVDMNDKQRADYEKNNEKKERGRITFNGRLYPNLHKLAELVYQKMAEHKEVFDDLPTASNKGKVVHRIGKQIATCRCKVARSDVHNRAPGEVNLELFNSDAYKEVKN